MQEMERKREEDQLKILAKEERKQKEKDDEKKRSELVWVWWERFDFEKEIIKLKFHPIISSFSFF